MQEIALYVAMRNPGQLRRSAALDLYGASWPTRLEKIEV
jgi:hypothetical protein